MQKFGVKFYVSNIAANEKCIINSAVTWVGILGQLVLAVPREGLPMTMYGY